jgi:hypothetical protein
LPGLDLAVIRGVTLSLREDASLVEAGENALAITGCGSRKFHPIGFAREGESAHHPK